MATKKQKKSVKLEQPSYKTILRLYVSQQSPTLPELKFRYYVELTAAALRRKFSTDDGIVEFKVVYEESRHAGSWDMPSLSNQLELDSAHIVALDDEELKHVSRLGTVRDYADGFWDGLTQEK